MYFKKLVTKVLILLVVAVTLTGVVSPAIVNAVTKPVIGSLSTTDEARSWAYYNALQRCMMMEQLIGSGSINYDRVSESDAKAGKWFDGKSDGAAIGYGFGYTDNNGLTSCGQGDWIVNAFNFWGYDTSGNGMIQAICDSGAVRVSGYSCVSGSGDFKGGVRGDFNFESKLSISSFKSNLVKHWKFGNTSYPSLSRPAQYIYERTAFFEGCLNTGSPTPYVAPAIGTSTPPSSSGGGTVAPSLNYMYKIKFADNNGTLKENTYDAQATGGKATTESISYMVKDDHTNNSNTCAGLAASVNNNAALYQAWARANPGKDEGGAAGAAGTGNTGSGKTTCVIDGVGWIVCSMTSFLAKVTDGISSLILKMVETPPINVDTASSTNGVYNAWSIMRNIANVCFVIAFLIIIMSQLTNVGITNYGVKKTLPRLIIVAILVNISYWITAIGVDVSNILGKGIYDLLLGAQGGLNVGISQNWGNIIGALLGGGGVTIGTVGAAAGVVSLAPAIPELGAALLYLAIPMVIAAVIAVFVAVFILVVRQGLITILIVLSPLAFVAYLLPNTEKLFTKWRQLLVSLLLMYPIFSIILAGSQLAGLVIMASAATTKDPASTMIAIVTGQFVTVAPLFLLPMMISKFSGGNLGAIGAQISAKGKNLLGGASSFGQKRGMEKLGIGYEGMKYGPDFEPKLNSSGNETAISRARRGLRSRARGFGQWLDTSQSDDAMASDYIGGKKKEAMIKRLGSDPTVATRIAGGDVAEGKRIAGQAIAAQEADELKKAQVPLKQEVAAMRAANPAFDSDTYLKNRALSTTHSIAEKTAAMHELASTGRGEAIRELDSAMSGADKIALHSAIDSNVSALGSSPDVFKGADKAFSSVTGSQLVSFDKDTAKRYIEHLGTLHSAATAVGATQAQIDAFKQAGNSFNTALQDIASDSSLQASFKSDIGTVIKTEATRNSALSANLHDLSRIDQTGKIR